jgi:hypothetical protein
MDRIQKKLSCDFINKEIEATYFIENVVGVDGETKKRTVQYYNCGEKENCEISYNFNDCVCFREMKRVEVEVNNLGNNN